MKFKKADMPISPLIILILALLFGILAFFFIKTYLQTGQEEALSIFDIFI